jgi:hypothetical protein
MCAAAAQRSGEADFRNGVNEEIGPRVKVVKVNADDACSDNVAPLDSLPGVMRDAESPAALRLRVAGIVAPDVHRKVDEPPVAMTVVEDPYWFDAVRQAPRTPCSLLFQQVSTSLV